MKRFLAIVAPLAVANCAPPYLWGSEHQIKERLLRMVPPGSSPSRLEATATERGWKIDHLNMRVSAAGKETYFQKGADDCRTKGGWTVPAVLAHYSSPLDTYVESLWLFDAGQRLRDVCVRRTADAP
jgi:hypothetical protein